MNQNAIDNLMENPGLIVLGIFVAFILLEAIAGCLRQPKAQHRDVLLEVVGSSLLLGLTVPLIMLITDAGLHRVASQWRDALADMPWLLGFGLFLVFDDMTQYWWHRLSHKVPVLYSLHRAHHSAPYMSVRIVYRNNSFYYLLMPGIWLSAGLVYLGLAPVYYVYLIIKMLVIFGAHSSLPWDEKLYRLAPLRPLMWLLERTISTPSTHAAHHGLSADDGVTHYKGNYGNLLFFWDILFGTAKITRRRPDAYGIEHLKAVSWQQELFWPLVRRPRKTPVVAAEEVAR
nr:sterol desaturase family protein [uncultured Pseudomonas sp.]